MLLFLTVKNWFCKVSLVCLGVNWFRWPCDCVHVCMHQLTISKIEHSHHLDKYISIKGLNLAHQTPKITCS